MIPLVIAGIFTVVLSYLSLNWSKRRLTPDGKFTVFCALVIGIFFITVSGFKDLVTAIIGFSIVIFIIYMSLAFKQRWFSVDVYLEKSGKTLTDLRPSGMADIDGEKVDVVSRGEYIDKGTDIVVISVQGNQVIVRSTNV